MLGTLALVLLTWPGGMTACEAVRVVDGDTARISCTGRQEESLRLFGGDTPERGQPGFAEATEAFEALLRSQPVWLGTVMDTDRYGRPVVRLLAGGVDASCAMIEGGWAVEMPEYSNGRYADCEPLRPRARP